MSAYIVGKAHIDALVRVALEGPAGVGPMHAGDGWRFYFYAPWLPGDVMPEAQRVTPETADDLGRMLWRENLLSVEYRYPDTAENHAGYPGPIGFERADVEAYEYPRRGEVRHLTVPETFKALDGYEYQTCESPGWRRTTAYGFVDGLRSTLIGYIPGYREADTWEVREAVTS